MDGDERFTLRLLGGFELADRGSALDVPEATRKVVAYLGLRDRPSSRALIAAELWPDKPEPRASANLRSAVWRLRGSDLSPLVLVRGAELSLQNVAVDVRQLRDDPSIGWPPALLVASTNGHADARRDEPGTGAARQQPRAPWTGADTVADQLLFEPLLPGWTDPWVAVERERLAQRQLHRLDAVIDDLLCGRDPSRPADVARAIDLALRLVALDPLRERSQAALIRAYAAEGSYGHARRQYEQYRDLVERATGLPCRLSYEDAAADAPRSSPTSGAAGGG